MDRASLLVASLLVGKCSLIQPYAGAAFGRCAGTLWPKEPCSADYTVNEYMDFAPPVLGEPRAAAICDHILGLIAEASRYSDLAVPAL